MTPTADRVDKGTSRSLWFDAAMVTLVIVFVAIVYGARLTTLPIVGEESRWATAAREMLATGDWIVPRQQGRVFSERPPMTIWAMAAVGAARGEVDAIAVRLPSVVAIGLTALLIYGYTRQFASCTAALAAALCYATMGQVLQIGRMGESEAIFTLLVSASLLLWHLGYTRSWGPLATWSTGFACAALAALVKGPQAPVYFVAITGVYLLARRDWRYLVRWQYAAGAALLAAIVAAWQIPFLLATDWEATVATWAGLAADRFQLGGALEHIATYPIETFACLLPWSPLLVALVSRKTRALLSDQSAIVLFLAIALVVAYPTVWVATGARGRYFMPLYPLVAVLVGVLVERCSAAAPDLYPRRAWHQFLLLTGSLIAVGGLASLAAGLASAEWIAQLDQPRWFYVAFGGLAMAATWTLWQSYRRWSYLAPAAAVLSIAVVVGTAYSGIVISFHSARWNNPTNVVEHFKQQIPADAELVSLSPIDHRFVYYYTTLIDELDWPSAPEALPSEVDYFCFMRYPGDTAESRLSGRGRSWGTTSGTLPFAWEEVTSICVERRLRDTPQRTVVLGRIIRPLQTTVSDVTIPQAPVRQAARN